MEKYVLSLDSGTTSNRAILFNHAGEIVAMANQEFEQIYPRPGWVEHNALTIWETQLQVARKVLMDTGISASQVAGIGITNQRETTVLWNRDTGIPVFNAIVWQDRRTSDICQKLQEAGHEPTITAKTGLIADAYFSATKIRWILDNVAGAQELAQSGKTCLRHHRYLAGMETHRRPAAHYRCHQCQPDHAL
jgi:glycerol kinase